MMEYVVVHPGHFENPKSAFFIGFMLFLDMLMLEALNLLQSLSYTDPTNLITGYISFRVNQQIPAMFSNAMEDSTKKPSPASLYDKLQI